MGAIFKSVKRVSELMKCEFCFKGMSQSPPLYTTLVDPGAGSNLIPGLLFEKKKLDRDPLGKATCQIL